MTCTIHWCCLKTFILDFLHHDNIQSFLRKHHQHRCMITKHHGHGGMASKPTQFEQMISLPKFNSSPLKNHAWKRILSFWVPAYFQGRAVKLPGSILPEFVSDLVTPMKLTRGSDCCDFFSTKSGTHQKSWNTTETDENCKSKTVKITVPWICLN